MSHAKETSNEGGRNPTKEADNPRSMQQHFARLNVILNELGDRMDRQMKGSPICKGGNLILDGMISKQRFLRMNSNMKMKLVVLVRKNWSLNLKRHEMGMEVIGMGEDWQKYSSGEK